MGAAALLEQLKSARQQLDFATNLLAKPSPEALDSCSSVLEAAARQLAEWQPAFSQQAGNAAPLEEAWRLRRSFVRTSRLLQGVGGQHSRLARALNVGRDQIADLFRILSERTRVNDWIGGIRVYVGVGKEDPVNAYGAGFLGGDAAEGLGVFELAVSSEGHGVRKVGGAH